MNKYLVKVILLVLALFAGEALLLFIAIRIPTPIETPCGQLITAPCASAYPTISAEVIVGWAMVAYLILVFVIIGFVSFRYYQKRLESNDSNAIWTIMFVWLGVLLVTGLAFLFVRSPNVLIDIINSVVRI